MDHEELIKKYGVDRDTLPDDVREHVDWAYQLVSEKLDRGEFVEPKPGDNFAIGLDDNYDPFPVHDRDNDTTE